MKRPILTRDLLISVLKYYLILQLKTTHALSHFQLDLLDLLKLKHEASKGSVTIQFCNLKNYLNLYLTSQVSSREL